MLNKLYSNGNSDNKRQTAIYLATYSPTLADLQGIDNRGGNLSGVPPPYWNVSLPKQSSKSPTTFYLTLGDSMTFCASIS